MPPRIAPPPEPHPPEAADRLASTMPPGVPPIGRFRTFVRNLSMTDGLNAWGGFYLSRKLSISLRELVSDRACALRRARP